MSNSPLVGYTKLSPNHSGKRTHAIDTITIHCVVGQVTVETLGNIFAPTARQASSNYGIGLDGRVGLYVDEGNRSWCSSSNSNDQRAVTIEVASDTVEPYAVRDAAYNALIQLVADICRRNGISKLVWSNDKKERVGHLNGCNMTAHRDFSATRCPGSYLYNKMPEIAATVNALLAPAPAPETGLAYNVGDVVYFKGGSHYAASDAASGSAAPKSNAKITVTAPGKRHPYHVRAVDAAGSFIRGVYGWVDTDTLSPLNTQNPASESISVGDKVKLCAGASRFTTGQTIAGWLKGSTLYVRAVEQGGKVLLVSTEPVKQVYTGRVYASDVTKV